MRELLGRYLDDVADDDDITVVLLRGAEGVFSTGADMNNAYGWYGDERSREEQTSGDERSREEQTCASEGEDADKPPPRAVLVSAGGSRWIASHSASITI